jgi:Tol biopolymer transport system component
VEQPRSFFGVTVRGARVPSRGAIPTDQRLTWLDRAGTPQATVFKVGRFSNLDLSPDGKRVAVASGQIGKNSDIWIIELSRGDGVPLTSDPAWEFDPSWSRDGRRIAFNSDRMGGRFNLFSRPSDGSGSDQLMVTAVSAASAPAWSPRDDSILYEDDGDLWINPDQGDGKPFVVSKTEARESTGSFSLDGRWIAYVSDKTGRAEVYIRAYPSDGAEHKVSLDGGRPRAGAPTTRRFSSWHSTAG